MKFRKKPVVIDAAKALAEQRHEERMQRGLVEVSDDV